MTHKLVISLEGGVRVLCKSNDGYGLKDALLRAHPATGRLPDGLQHVTGRDASDIYFRRERVVAVVIEP